MRLLLVTGIKDLRAVLGAFVGALAVQFGRIMRHRKIDLQKLAERDLRWVKSNLDGLRVARRNGAHDFVMRGGLVATRVSATASDTPFTTSNTASTPQKHPRAKMAVSDPFSDRFSSTAGRGKLAALKVKPAAMPAIPMKRTIDFGNSVPPLLDSPRTTVRRN
jgi:hypothetical protein